MKPPRYQYLLFGLYGEWLGITKSITVARAHSARGDWAYFRRVEYDAADVDWERARERGLTCE